jgi:hypothetical protein
VSRPAAYPPDRRTCSVCGRSKPLDCFWARPGRPRGYSTRCKVCDAIYQAAWRATAAGRVSVAKSASAPAERARKPARDAASYRRRKADGRLAAYRARPDVKLRRARSEAARLLDAATSPGRVRELRRRVEAIDRELIRLGVSPDREED